MPELPEVEVVRRGLAAHVLDQQVHRVEALHPRVVRRQVGGPAHFESVLTGRTLIGTGRRGKFLLCQLTNVGKTFSGDFILQIGKRVGDLWREDVEP